MSESPLGFLRGTAFEIDLRILGNAFRKLCTRLSGEKNLGYGRAISVISIRKYHFITQSCASTLLVDFAC